MLESHRLNIYITHFNGDNCIKWFSWTVYTQFAPFTVGAKIKSNRKWKRKLYKQNTSDTSNVLSFNITG